jgi:thioesterase domain-containing protein
MRRTLLRWSKLALGYPTQAVTMFDLSRSTEEQVEWFEAGLQAIRAYRPKPLRAPITLFRADVQLLSHLALDSTLGWGEVTQSEIKVRVVPGSHRSIATEPLVRHLAASLSDELDAVQRLQ